MNGSLLWVARTQSYWGHLKESCRTHLRLPQWGTRKWAVAYFPSKYAHNNIPQAITSSCNVTLRFLYSRAWVDLRLWWRWFCMTSEAWTLRAIQFLPVSLGMLLLVGSPNEPSQRNYMVFQPSDPAEDPATASTYCQQWEWAVLLWFPTSVKSLWAFASSQLWPKHHREKMLYALSNPSCPDWWAPR